MIILVLAFGIITWYLWSFIKLYGVPTSISGTFYKEIEVKFSATMISCAVLMAMGMSFISPEWYMRVLTCVASEGLMVVGTTPFFKRKHTLHYIGATMFIVATLIWSIIFSSWWIILIWLLFPILDKKRWVFWIESFTIITFILGVILGSI